MRNNLFLYSAIASVTIGAPITFGANISYAQDAPQNNVLPKPQKPFDGKIGTTRETSVQDWPEQIKAPKGAPNIVLILLDDVGFGSAETFGGPVNTPTLEELADNGVRYNQFHTTAISSPTRAALLSGRNHHQVGFGNLADIAAGFPAYNSIWSPQTASIAEILKGNGYSTAAVGKWHNTPNWEISPAGPFDRWPTGLGFEHFYGFMFGEASQYEPQLYRGTNPVEPSKTPEQGYHFTSDMVDESIKWINQHEAVAADKPYFLYFAPGAAHAPLHVPPEWVAKYKGKFDIGWDKLREETFKRQKKSGIIPANTKLTPRPDGLPAWDSLSADQKKLYARQMEVYAGFLEHTDVEIGRLLDAIKKTGDADNTLIFYIVGDNGGSAEGGLEGSEANFATLLGVQTSTEEQLKHIDELGSPEYDNHYASAWAWATTSPFQWMKQIASHYGGTRNGLVVSWANHTNNPKAVRSQFSHVNDIAPTIYDAAGITPPEIVKGVKQIPLEGKSLVETFTNAKAPEKHTTQYFEIFGNRAIYKDGWVAGARRYSPWELFSNPAKIFTKTDFENDKWELYHVAEDFSQANNLAAKYPEKLEELKKEFDKEAIRNGVYPLVPLPLGAPKVISANQKKFTYLTGVDRLTQSNVPTLGGRSHKITANLKIDDNVSNGVIIAEGGRYGGFTLYVKDNKLIYENNTLGQTKEKIIAAETLPKGDVEISTIFTIDPSKPDLSFLARLGGGLPKPGKAEIYIGNKKVAEGRFSSFGGFTSSITESFDIGKDLGSPVSAEYSSPNKFNGTVDKVTIELID